MSANDSRLTSPQFIAWGIVAAVAGVSCLVLPPFLATRGLPQPAYGWPLISWFAVAWANQRWTASMLCFLLLGFTLGIVQPRRWLPLSAVAIATPAILNAVNILHDWTVDGTSHNLFPFEFLFYAFLSLPAAVGAPLGLLCRRLFQRNRKDADEDKVPPRIPRDMHG